MDQRMLDTLAIKEVVENWAVFRDSGDWERFRTRVARRRRDDGNWFQGPFEEFIRVNQEGWNKGVSILHLLGGTSVEIAGARAIAQTKMTISQRAPVHGVVVDVLCTGRFYDFFEKRKDRWAIVLRRLFYEKDRMDPVDPSKTRAARSENPGAISRRLPSPGLLAIRPGIQGQGGYAGTQGSRRGRAVRSGKKMAGGRRRFEARTGAIHQHAETIRAISHERAKLLTVEECDQHAEEMLTTKSSRYRIRERATGVSYPPAQKLQTPPW